MAAKRRQTPKQRAAAKRNLKPAKKGEVRNPAGTNGWTKARARVQELLAERAEDITEKVMTLADEGDIQALKILIGPLMPEQPKQQVELSGGLAMGWESDEKPAPKRKPKANGAAKELH